MTLTALRCADQNQRMGAATELAPGPLAPESVTSRRADILPTVAGVPPRQKDRPRGLQQRRSP